MNKDGSSDEGVASHADVLWLVTRSPTNVRGEEHVTSKRTSAREV